MKIINSKNILKSDAKVLPIPPKDQNFSGPQVDQELSGSSKDPNFSGPRKDWNTSGPPKDWNSLSPPQFQTLEACDNYYYKNTHNTNYIHKQVNKYNSLGNHETNTGGLNVPQESEKNIKYKKL